MELNILDRKEYPLLDRTRIKSEIKFEEATPSKAEVKSQLSKDLGKDEKLIVVKNIYTKYGLKKAINLSYVYDNEEAMKRIEIEKEKTGKKKEQKETK